MGETEAKAGPATLDSRAFRCYRRLPSPFGCGTILNGQLCGWKLAQSDHEFGGISTDLKLSVGSEEEFFNSFAEYRKAIHWDVRRFDGPALHGARPFELICLPRTWASNSRVERQAAALMLPDVCNSDRLLDTREQDLRMMDIGVLASSGASLTVRDCTNHGLRAWQTGRARGAS